MSKAVLPEVIEAVRNLKPDYDLGLVCGYDLTKIQACLGESKTLCFEKLFKEIQDISLFDWVFAENGHVVLKNGQIHEKDVVFLFA